MPVSLSFYLRRKNCAVPQPGNFQYRKIEELSEGHEEYF